MVLSFFSFAIAATLGAALRYLVILKWSAPWATLAVNLLGSLLIGLLAVLLDRYYPQAKLIVLVAFLGSLTTFSSYSLDLVKMFEGGMAAKALLYMLLSNGLCFGGCFFGYKIAQNLVSTY